MTLANSGPCRNLNSRGAGAAVLLDDFGAGDVGRHQVGRELNAAERQRQRLRQRRNHQRLGQAGHAFEDAVAAAEQRDQQFFDDFVLADDDAAQLALDVVEAVAQLADGVEVFLAQVFDGGGRRRSGCGRSAVCRLNLSLMRYSKFGSRSS